MNYISIKKGYTLIELIIVIFVLAMISCIVMYCISFSGNLALRVNARQFCNDIREIRHKSMTTGVINVMLVSHEGYTIKNSTNLVKKVNYNGRYKIFWKGEANYIFSFGTDGQVNGGGNTITIKSLKTGKSMDISIVVGSGRVLLYDKIY